MCYTCSMRIESLRDLHGNFPDYDGYWNSEDLMGTEIRIRELSLTSPEALTQLARVQALQGNLPAARVTIDEARKAIFESGKPIDKRAELRWNLEQGRILCLTMTPAKALNFFTSAWLLAQDLGEVYFSIDAALMLSIIRPPKFQNEWLHKAIEIAETAQIPQAKMWLAQLYTMDGWHSFDFRQYDKALSSFEKALEKSSGQNSDGKTYVIEWCVGRALRALNRSEEALKIQKALQTKMSATGRANGHVVLEIAENMQVMGNTEEAKQYFEQAYNELSTDGWYSDNKASELSRMHYLAKKRT